MSKLPMNVDEDEDGMDIDLESRLERRGETGSTSLLPSAPIATIIRDAPNWLLNIHGLQSTDVIILLTPVVTPISQDPADISDPFEPLGRSLSGRHARIRHVPYTKRNGITSTHLGFIKRGHAIIFCLAVHPLHAEFVDVVFAVSDDKPVIVVCCSALETQHTLPFPTVIHTAGYSPPALEATAALIFAEQPRSDMGTNSLPCASSVANVQPKVWLVEDFDEPRDIPSIVVLWSACLGARFEMDLQNFAKVLRKPGYSKHYVVRSSSTGETLGFCATYLSYVDREGEKLVASLAILVVHPRYRLQGIGLSLHSHAIIELKRTRGIIRLQLGSTFPRILYGPPSDITTNDEWFRRRGWQLDKNSPGHGRVVYDLILDFEGWQYQSGLPASMAPKYRNCTQDDMMEVLDLVEKTSVLDDKLGWFDQYWALSNGPNVKDIVIATEERAIVGAALTYTPGGSQISDNLPVRMPQFPNFPNSGPLYPKNPQESTYYFIALLLKAALADSHNTQWAGRIGADVGGATCISIIPDKRDTVLCGLLNSCVENLQSQGMKRLFLDGVTDGLQDLTNLGFREWARYRDVWKSA